MRIYALLMLFVMILVYIWLMYINYGWKNFAFGHVVLAFMYFFKAHVAWQISRAISVIDCGKEFYIYLLQLQPYT